MKLTSEKRDFTSEKKEMTSEIDHPGNSYPNDVNMNSDY